MFRTGISVFLVLAMSVWAADLTRGAGPAAFDWEVATPESQGMSRARLDAMREALATRGTKTLLIIRRDRIVYEWYATGFSRTTRHYTASLAKALVGGMSLALAMNDGRIGPDDFAREYIPHWREDPRRSKIRIRHLATHSSGIEDAEIPGKSHGELPGWKGAFWRRDPNPFTISRDQAPVLFEPGSRFAYSNPGMAMLAYAVTASLKGQKHEDIRTLLRERIMRPIGVPDKEWSMGYGKTYEVEGLPLCANWGGGNYSPNAIARVGRLILRKGDWEGGPLIRREIVEQVTRDAGAPVPERVPPEGPFPRSGLGWYTNGDGVWPRVPRDAVAGAGAGNQVLLVVPSLELIVVRNGSQLQPNNFWGGMETFLFNPTMEATWHGHPAHDPPGHPLPKSNVIESVEFAPVDSIIRRATGSDNWPITWMDDDALFTSYGDGWGFEPRTEKKLSQGFARILGTPPEFRGVNVRSTSGERTGDGAKGAKASGLLMVDGVLYMWVRNTGNSTLVWSKDRGKTWTWGFRFTESFGCPTFLNFGKNYEGARDDHVYTYSQDGPSAYEPYDRVVLARAPKDKLTDRDAYEFFERIGASGGPVWTRDIRARGAVLENPGRCVRMEVVHNPGLERYLMCQAFRNKTGGWALLEAPEPWGPWRVAFWTDDWGLGDTHGFRIPTKWIRPDGRRFWLLFSGREKYDAFCLRECRLKLKR